MKRHGQPKWRLVVWGDWSTVIGVAGKWRDELLDQKPFDQEDAEYGEYHVACETTSELVYAYLAFHGGARLRVAFAVEFEPDKQCRVYAATDNGYGKNEPTCIVKADIDHNQVVNAANAAIEILREAMK